MKKKLLILCPMGVAMALILAWGIPAAQVSPSREDFSPGPMNPSARIVRLGGPSYEVAIRRCDPPVPVVAPLFGRREEAVYDTPEHAHLSQISARDRAWFLDAFDEFTRKILIRHDEESGGKFLGKFGQPFSWPPDHPTQYLARAEARVGGKPYAFLKIRVPETGADEVFTFVSERGRWVRTFALDEHPLVDWLKKTSVGDL